MILIAELSTEILKIKAAFISALFIFCAHLDLFTFAILSLLLMLYFKSFKLINTLMELYLTQCKLILLIRAIILITLALLACPR